MSEHPSFHWDYLLAGAVVLAVILLASFPLLGASPKDVSGWVNGLAALGFVAQALGTLVLVALAYPIGYLIHMLSFTCLYRVWRDRFYAKRSEELPQPIKAQLDNIYTTWEKDSGALCGSLKWGGGDRWFSLMRVLIQARNNDVYSRLVLIWDQPSRFGRVFSASFVLAGIILALPPAFRALGAQGIQEWGSAWYWVFGCLGCLVLGGLSGVIYWFTLKWEVRSLVSRYLVLHHLDANNGLLASPSGASEKMSEASATGS